MASPNIQMYVHCKQCFNELPRGSSMSEFCSLEVGWTEQGLQVWCKRHDLEVLHIRLPKEDPAYWEEN